MAESDLLWNRNYTSGGAEGKGRGGRGGQKGRRLRKWAIQESNGPSLKLPIQSTVTVLRGDRALVAGACFPVEVRCAVVEARCASAEAQTWAHFAPVAVGTRTFVRSNAAQQACRLYSHECY